MRFAADVGGTFTDLVVEDDDAGWRMYKTPTVPGDPAQGLLDVFAVAAADRGCSSRELLAAGEVLLHGTTQALNAVVAGRTARTALLTTQGHPDILLLREGGRTEPFNHREPYPEPYIPRSLTFEIPERTASDGSVLIPLDEAAAIETIAVLERIGVEAAAVCLLWSPINPAHELRVGELLDRYLPGLPYTLSHRINPVLREYRRASSAAIDASLKPLMSDYLCGVRARLGAAGFQGRILMLTSGGGVLDLEDVAAAPIHLLNSGPSTAPVAGRHFGSLVSGGADVIVADAGGTTYDVSLVRGGVIPTMRETWIGRPYLGHMTGFPSVDVKSIGAGGGSVASIDDAGALHVGPRSAGAEPGPACYGRGGEEPTVTDAALVLGYLDPANFFGGRLHLSSEAAVTSIERGLCGRLGLSVREAAWAILSVATENMVQAILEITVDQGIDPGDAVLIGGGGAAGLNSTFIARRLGCRTLIFPPVGAALSAAGALLCDLRSPFRAAACLSTAAFDREAANRVLGGLRHACEDFFRSSGAASLRKLEGDTFPRCCTGPLGRRPNAALPRALRQWIEYSVEARYRNQVWDIEVPLRAGRFESEAGVTEFIEDFHAAHKRHFGVSDPASPVEIVNWSATACCRLREPARIEPPAPEPGGPGPRSREACFEGGCSVDTAVHAWSHLPAGVSFQGPAIVESTFTTIVIDAGGCFRRTENGSLVVEPAGAGGL